MYKYGIFTQSAWKFQHWGKTDGYSEGSLYLTRLPVRLGYSTEPLIPPACLPTHPPAQQLSTRAGELLPWLFLKHPTNTHIRTHTLSRPLLCLSAKRGINTPPLTACTHVIEGRKRRGGGGGEQGWTCRRRKRRTAAGEEGNVDECRARGQRVRERGEKRELTRKMSSDQRQTRGSSNI